MFRTDCPRIRSSDREVQVIAFVTFNNEPPYILQITLIEALTGLNKLEEKDNTL
jgi:hypothetical protein